MKKIILPYLLTAENAGEEKEIQIEIVRVNPAALPSPEAIQLAADVRRTAELNTSFGQHTY